MRSSSDQASEGLIHANRGAQFENSVADQLRNYFGTVQTHVRIPGYSGVRWSVDILVDSKLMVEASVQKRMDTKITATFIRLADIVRKHRGLKGCLVLEDIHVGYHATQGKSYFPTSEFRAMTSFGFPILKVGDLEKLEPFLEGRASAFESSTLPVGFRLNSVSSDRAMIQPRIIEVLSRGAAPRRAIAKEVGRRPDFLTKVLSSMPGVVKIGSYYGLSEEQIYRKFVSMRHKSHDEREGAIRWITGEYFRALEEGNRVRTFEFANKIGVRVGHVLRIVHELSKIGVITQVSKGTWTLTKNINQRKLTQLI